MSRVVVITGASAGVGRAAARAFADRGAAVALLARGEKGLTGNTSVAPVSGLSTWLVKGTRHLTSG